MEQPYSIYLPYPHRLYRLYRSLYILKQALKAWFSRLINKLWEFWFHDSKTNTSLFMWHKDGYNDNIIITCTFGYVI